MMLIDFFLGWLAYMSVWRRTDPLSPHDSQPFTRQLMYHTIMQICRNLPKASVVVNILGKESLCSASFLYQVWRLRHQLFKHNDCKEPSAVYSLSCLTIDMQWVVVVCLLCSPESDDNLLCFRGVKGQVPVHTPSLQIFHLSSIGCPAIVRNLPNSYGVWGVDGNV